MGPGKPRNKLRQGKRQKLDKHRDFLRKLREVKDYQDKKLALIAMADPQAYLALLKGRPAVHPVVAVAVRVLSDLLKGFTHKA